MSIMEPHKVEGKNETQLKLRDKSLQRLERITVIQTRRALRHSVSNVTTVECIAQTDRSPDAI